METLYFEGRHLVEHAEPTSSTRNLVVGQVYFSLNYLDSQMTIPLLEPVVFVGVDLEQNDQNQAYFQDADSYSQGVRHQSQNTEAPATFYCGPADAINHIFDFEHALEELMRCAIRRTAK